jgi:hypothetical protein
MNSRERFNNSISFQPVDRPPLFAEGIRPGVIANWRQQGLAANALDSLFIYDDCNEFEPDFDPRPEPVRWPETAADLPGFRKLLDPNDRSRFPADWEQLVQSWRTRSKPLMLQVNEGFFISIGVDGWQRFARTLYLTRDDPVFVRELLQLQGEFAAELASQILTQVEVDAVIFSEPIGGNHGPLISPSMYRSLVLPSYQPIFEVVARYQVEAVILRSYANIRILLPTLVEAGINCLWACECDTEAMDYIDIRREYGKSLRLIGGIDADWLYGSEREMFANLERVVPPLLAEGGYIPLADGRVREEVPFAKYQAYRLALQQIVQSSSPSLKLQRSIVQHENL